MIIFDEFLLEFDRRFLFPFLIRSSLQKTDLKFWIGIEDISPIWWLLIFTARVSFFNLVPSHPEHDFILINCSIHSLMPEDFVCSISSHQVGIAPSQPPEYVPFHLFELYFISIFFFPVPYSNIRRTSLDNLTQGVVKLKIVMLRQTF